MKQPKIVQFIIEKAEEGGYNARALFYSIFTQGATLDELVINIREATDCHFNDDSHTLPILVNFEVPATA